MRRTATAYALLLFISWPEGADGQYLNREYYPLWQKQGYENYAHFGYRDMRLIRQGQALLLDEETRTYDPFGTTLLHGVDLYRGQEFRTLSPFGGSRLFKDPLYRELFQNLVVANDTYEGWSSSLIVGRAVEARFSPMLLSSHRMNGIRWDGDSRRNSFSVVGSRISDPVQIFELSRPLDFATYLFGGHWQTQIGSILTFSASYANTHYTDTLLDRGRGSFRKGVFPTSFETPGEIFLAVSDDSPEDGAGARIHAVEIYINGERSDLKPQIRKVAGLLATGQQRRMISERMRLEDLPHARQRESWLPRVMGYGSLFDANNGLFNQGEVLDGETGILEASDDDVLLYRFELPPQTGDVSFRVLASNDYAIDIGATIDRVGVVGQSWGDWRNATRAAGNVRDETNLGWVEVDYGFPSGLELYGAAAELDLFGFDIRGNYNVSTHHLVFPVSQGPRHRDRAQSYALLGKRDFGRFDLGFELFEVPPNYRTAFSYWNDAVPGLRTYQFVDDNDDRDQWPDSWEHEDPLSLRFQDDITASSEDALENLSPRSLRAIGFGVFPGLDDNSDGITDTNVNNNLVPDYQEPFLMYYVEPESFVYGDDFNNNGLVDSRENDSKPDYSYELDSRGRHLFATVKPASKLSVTLGAHDIDQIAGGGRNRSLYARVQYERPLGNFVKMDLRHRTKRVQDSIPDPVYQYVANPLLVREVYELALQPDPLGYRNSLASLSYVRFDYAGSEALDLNSTWRYEINRRLDATFDDGQVQKAGSDWSLAVVNRADYAWKPAARWVVTPMLKWTYRRAYSALFEATTADEKTLVPIVRADYHLTERTLIRGGLQGVPFFKHRYRNDAAPFQDFDAWHYIAALQNLSSYTGYQVSLNMGFRRSFTDFVGGAALGEVATSEFFVQVRTN